MTILIKPDLVGVGFSVVLVDFEPSGGYESFLKDFCIFSGVNFDYWHQGVMEGIGRMAYGDSLLEVYWTDFPFALSFSCEDENLAKSLESGLHRYFSKQK